MAEAGPLTPPRTLEKGEGQENVAGRLVQEVLNGSLQSDEAREAASDFKSDSDAVASEALKTTDKDVESNASITGDNSTTFQRSPCEARAERSDLLEVCHDTQRGGDDASQSRNVACQSPSATTSISEDSSGSTSERVLDERPKKRRRHVVLPFLKRSDAPAEVERTDPVTAHSTQSRSQTASTQPELPSSAVAHVTRRVSTDRQASKKPKLLLSTSIHLSKDATQFLKSMQVTIHSNTNGYPKDRSNLICVITNDGSVATMKCLITLTSNGTVVTEAWLQDSLRNRRLQDLEPYIPAALSDTTTRDRKTVFTGKTLIFTPFAAGEALDWARYRALACDAGAADVIRANCEEIKEMRDPEAPDERLSDSDILIGLDMTNDGDSRDLLKNGMTVFHRHLLARAIIRGKFDRQHAERDGLLVRPSSSRISRGRH